MNTDGLSDEAVVDLYLVILEVKVQSRVMTEEEAYCLGEIAKWALSASKAEKLAEV